MCSYAEALTCALDTPASAATFQRRLNGYYGVRRNAAWRSALYVFFEAAKASPPLGDGLFAESLEALHARTGRWEASFVSKLVATLQPSSPVIDSMIRAVLSRWLAAPAFGTGAAAAIAYHAWLQEVMLRLAESESATAWIAAFDQAFSHAWGAADIDPVKKLDFLLWADGCG